MDWFYLLLAGACEIIWAVGIKHCEGFKLTPALFMVSVAMIMSVVFLGLAIKTIPLGIAYAAWSAIGIVGVYLYGVLVLKEEFSITTILFIGLILIGIIGLKLKSH